MVVADEAREHVEIPVGALGQREEEIGFLPAWIALTLYAALPILRNTVAGIASVPAALREAALGVGMTPAQQLRRVELPLALPVIVAGVRTAAVWPFRLVMCCPVAASPNLLGRSSPAEASKPLAGLNATLWTGPWWPRTVRISKPDCASQILIV